MDKARDVFSLAHPQALVGKPVGVSDWVVVDQPRIDGFARDTGDNQWIHVDVARAERESPFGGTIAHGYLTLALVASTTMDVLIKPAGIAQALNYGLDRVRFLSPVKVGARIRNHIKLGSVENRGAGRFLLTTENSMEIEGQEKPALTATMLVLVSG